MSTNRYVGDYRLIEEFDARGRVRTRYEYVGEDYFFKADPDTVRRCRRRLLAVCTGGWIAFICSFLPQSLLSRTLYAALPEAFSAVPLVMLSDLGISMLFWREPLEHRQADRMGNRFPPLALMLALCGGAAVTGAIIRLTGGGDFLSGDICFIVCALFLTICGLYTFSLRRRLETYTRQSTTKKEDYENEKT